MSVSGKAIFLKFYDDIRKFSIFSLTFNPKHKGFKSNGQIQMMPYQWKAYLIRVYIAFEIRQIFKDNEYKHKEKLS